MEGERGVRKGDKCIKKKKKNKREALHELVITEILAQILKNSDNNTPIPITLLTPSPHKGNSLVYEAKSQTGSGMS